MKTSSVVLAALLGSASAVRVQGT